MTSVLPPGANPRLQSRAADLFQSSLISNSLFKLEEKDTGEPDIYHAILSVDDDYIQKRGATKYKP